MKRAVVKVAVGTLVMALLGAGVLVVVFFRPHMGVDDWVLRQVLLITESYLTPIVRFERSEFRWPGTLRLEGLALESRTGGDVLVADEVVITLAQPPRVGAPIQIAALELRGAELNLVRDPGTGEFIGLTPFVRSRAVRNPESVPAQARLSRVLHIKRIDLRNGAVSYREGEGGTPMRLDGIDVTLLVERATDGAPDAASDGALWHTLDLSLDRAPILSLAAQGAVSLDTLEARLDRLDLSMMLGPKTYENLPAALQTLARAHDARGALRVLLSGAGALASPAGAHLDGTITLDDFNISAGGYRLPIHSATVEAHLADGSIRLAPARAYLLGGDVSLTAHADLPSAGAPAGAPDQIAWGATWRAEGLDLENLLKAQPKEGAQPPLDGLLVSSGEVAGRYKDGKPSVHGKGDLVIGRARLLVLPIMTKIARVIDALGSVIGGSSRNAEVRAEFDLTDTGVQFRQLRFENPVAVVDATGSVSYDRRLDLWASAGPLKKITGLFGKIGDMIGAVTGQLIRYRITGTVDEPVIEARPLGLGS